MRGHVIDSCRHPGEILAELLSATPELTQAELAVRLGVSRPRLNQLLRGKRSITPDTALRLARFFGTPAEMWMAAQARWDVAQAEREGETAAAIRSIGAYGRPVRLPDDLASAGGDEYLRDFLREKGLLEAAERYAEFRGRVDRLQARDRI